MGLFRKSIANIEVLFYDDLKGNGKDYSQVSVEYSSDINNVKLTAKHFSLFVKKVLFCLGRSEAAYFLLDDLRESFKKGITKDTDMSSGDGYRFFFVPKAHDYTKFSKATFYSNDTLSTKFSVGYEEFYSSISVFAFLQFIIDNYSENMLVEFNNAVPYYIDGIV